MKLNTLLENLEVTEKSTLRFMFVLQEFLMEKYPSFKATIVRNIKDNSSQSEDELSLAIKWQLLDVTLLVVPEVLSFSNVLVLWFNCADNKPLWLKNISSIDLPLSDFRADELNFDIAKAMSTLFVGLTGMPNTQKKIMVKLILMQANDGQITSIKEYFT